MAAGSAAGRQTRVVGRLSSYYFLTLLLSDFADADGAVGKEGLTKAGLLMFGKGLSIREVFPQFRVEYN